MVNKDEEDVLGRYAFANDRVSSAQVPAEVDTARETQLMHELQRIFRGSSTSRPISRKDVDLLKGFLARGIYDDVFRPPWASTIYRGMSVDEAWLVAAGLKEDEINAIKKTRRGRFDEVDKVVPIRKNGSFTYTPRRGSVSSWTLSYRTARQFAFSNRGFDGLFVVMCASVDDNPGMLLSGPGGLYNVGRFSFYDNEDEVIALEPVKVSKIRAWAYAY